MFDIFKTSRVKALDIYNDMVDFLVVKYKQSREVFSYGTSLGQILLVLNNHVQIMLFYIQDSITELNFLTAKRPTSVYNLAGLTGHQPAKARGAIGEISLITNQLTNSDIQGDYIIITNLTRLKCLANNLTYLINIADTDVAINIHSNNPTNVRILEGTSDFQITQGDGGDIQTYEFNIPTGKLIDGSTIEITVNGIQAEVFESLYDIPFGVLGVLVKTGNTGGFGLVFGNSKIHKVPENGAEIRADYTLCNGISGNLLFNEDISFTFLDTGFDINGNEIDLNKHFSINVGTQPILGSNPEPMQLTRILAPNVSRNFIIHDKTTCEYFFRKLNYFSILKVYKILGSSQVTNELQILAIPRITDRLATSEDYFSMDKSKFLLLDIEQTRILNMLDESGRKSSNLVLSFLQPVLKRYVFIIQVDAFESIGGRTTTKQKLKEQMKSVLNNYLLNNQRIDKIPHSDIVKNIDNIDFVDSVKVGFVSEDNEINSGSNLGFDNLGNIVVGFGEYAIIRGGFTDRNGIKYDDSFNVLTDKPCSVNISINFIQK